MQLMKLDKNSQLDKVCSLMNQYDCCSNPQHKLMVYGKMRSIKNLQGQVCTKRLPLKNNFQQDKQQDYFRNNNNQPDRESVYLKKKYLVKKIHHLYSSCK